MNINICLRYNQLKQHGKQYREIVSIMAEELHYTGDYMRKLISKSFKDNGVEMWRKWRKAS